MYYQVGYFIDFLLTRNFHFTITSALRTEQQNIRCKGAKNSQHLTGHAIDIKAYPPCTYDALVLMISDFCKTRSVMYDQLILYPTFVHISFSDNPRCQVINKR